MSAKSDARERFKEMIAKKNEKKEGKGGKKGLYKCKCKKGQSCSCNKDGGKCKCKGM